MFDTNYLYVYKSYAFQKQKAKVELADREKVMLQKQLAEKSKNLKDKNDNNSMGVLGQGDTAPEK